MGKEILVKNSVGAYYNGPQFKCQHASGTGWLFYKIWTKTSKTPMVNLLKNLRPFLNYNFKYNGKSIFLLFFNYWSNHSEIFFSYVIRYTFQANLNQKMHESERAGFFLRALLEVQNQFQKQILLKSIPNYITKFFSERFDQWLKKVKNNYLPSYFKIVISKRPKLFSEIDHMCFRVFGPVAGLSSYLWKGLLGDLRNCTNNSGLHDKSNIY